MTRFVFFTSKVGLYYITSYILQKQNLQHGGGCSLQPFQGLGSQCGRSRIRRRNITTDPRNGGKNCQVCKGRPGVLEGVFCLGVGGVLVVYIAMVSGVIWGWKMEVLKRIWLFGGWVFPYISLIHTAYIGEESSILGT